jgi:hypothetical protein
MSSNAPPFNNVPVAISFRRVHHTITIPVLLENSIHSRFILDTGIGGNLISSTLCKRIGCKLTGEQFTGKRMSGQEVSVPLATVSQISIGSFENKDVVVGVFDFPLPADFDGVDGFLSLQFFAENPFTIDYSSGNIIIENRASMLTRIENGTVVDVRLERVGQSIDAFLKIKLPDEKVIEAEVDTGTDELILHTKFMEELGVSKGSKGVKQSRGEDETGHFCVRYFASLLGRVCLAMNSRIHQQDPDVMFQDIIYDGLVGQRFLSRFTITYDIAKSRFIFENSKS